MDDGWNWQDGERMIYDADGPEDREDGMKDCLSLFGCGAFQLSALVSLLIVMFVRRK